MVMYLGRIAEIGPADAILGAPRHPYTAALLASQPSTDPEARLEEAPLTGDPPNPINPPPGCRFHTRCRFAAEVCHTREPGLDPVAAAHFAACHMASPGSGHPDAPPVPKAREALMNAPLRNPEAAADDALIEVRGLTVDFLGGRKAVRRSSASICRSAPARPWRCFGESGSASP